MKRYLQSLICFITGVLLHGNAVAQPSKDDNNSLLWRINSKEMKKPSYLFGTIHLICHDDYIWTQVMQKSLSQSEEVCFEMDLDDPTMMMQVATGMLDKSGKTLKDYFSEEDYNKLERYMKDSLGMDLSLFQQMKPVALQTLFTTQSVSCGTTESYENNIMQEAQKENKEITGLESVSEQLDLFDNLPADSVIKEIIDQINGRSVETADDFSKLTTAYKRQDLSALYKLIKASQQKDMDLTSFLDVRNEKWVPRIVEKMDKHSVFFAVGAGHLPGENGLINLLRKAGYTVSPIKK